MRHLRSSLPVLGIVLLVVLDVGLVYLAYEHTRPDPTSSAASAPPATLPGATTNDPTAGGPNLTPNISTGPSASPFVEGPVLLDAAPDGTVVRATRGDCGSDDARATVEVSSDSGATFERAGTGVLQDVLRVSASGADNIVVVGADVDCKLMAYVSHDGGDNWDATASSGDYWHLDLYAASVVRAPGRDAQPGCVVRALAPLTESGARVLCADGELRGTSNAGTSWVGLGALDGAVDVYYVDTGTGWAVGTAADCDAAVYQTSDGGANWDQQACLGGGEPQAASMSGGVVTVEVGGTIHTSDDGGGSWTSP